MKHQEKNEIMDKFAAGSIDILVSTTVIEVGIDIPNANVIVIEHAERFGLSQLHQLRGRVGRGEHQSFCVLIHPDDIASESIERLNVLESTDDGFAISEQDLKMRGSGEILGSRQHGARGDFEFTDLSLDLGLIEKAREIARENVSQIHNINQSISDFKDKNSGTDFDDITEGNIMAIAVAFSNEGQRSFSVPPDSFPFDAFYVEATAAATTTEQWSNATSEPGFTHTVFVEEGTSQTCGYCPRTRQALFAIHTFDSYPFFYAAMVTQNPKAGARLSEHDMYYVPTCYFDDGYEVYVGGNTDQSVYSSRIISSGARDVHDLDLEISLNWLGGAEIEAIFTITNNELINEPPDIPSTPGGVSEGTVSTDYQFTATTTDPDANAVYYKWDWGNGVESDWLGPYNSGETCEETYQWADAGTYDVTVKAKDEWDAECDWSPALTVDIAEAYLCGDANDDEAINLLDILYLISYIYGTPQGPSPNPMEAGDANADSDINLLDILYLIDHVYGSPPGPAPQCP